MLHLFTPDPAIGSPIRIIIGDMSEPSATWRDVTAECDIAHNWRWVVRWGGKIYAPEADEHIGDSERCGLMEVTK